MGQRAAGTGGLSVDRLARRTASVGTSHQSETEPSSR